VKRRKKKGSVASFAHPCTILRKKNNRQGERKGIGCDNCCSVLGEKKEKRPPPLLLLDKELASDPSPSGRKEKKKKKKEVFSFLQET